MNIVQGSILDFKGDAIVNPANSHLNHSGGLAAIIAKAAVAYPPPMHEGGNDAEVKAWQDEQLSAPLIATGNAYATSAGALRYKAIIHAVGPVWNGGHFYEDQLLMSAHRSALRVAREKGCQSIAFPAISAGVFGFPIKGAAYNAVRILTGPDALGLDVSVYLFEDAHMRAYLRAARVFT